MSRPEARQLPWCLCHQEVVGVWKAPPPHLQGLEFQKGSKVNPLQALTKEKPERQVGEGPKGLAGAKLVRGYWGGESPRPQGSRSI